MKRLLMIGSLAGLIGISAGSSRADSQLPRPSGDSRAVPRATPMIPGVAAPSPAPPAIQIPATPDLPPQSEVLPPSARYAAPTHSANSKAPPYYGSTVVPGINYGPTAWQPGGYSARRGRPYYYMTPERNRPLYSVHEISGTPWAFDHSAYQYHFGPGFYRHSEGGHYRFPYYTYRAPWYFPGHPIYNRDTNRPW